MNLNGRTPGLLIALTTGILFCSLHGHAQIEPDSTEGNLASQVLESAREYRDRKIYTTLSTDILNSTPDKDLSQVIVDYVRAKLKGSLKDELEVLQKEPELVRNVYVVSQIQAEVNNGGFSQLFSGSASHLADSAARCFSAIKAPHHVEVLNNAIAVQKAGADSQKLQALDDQFFDLYDKENLNKLKILYIRKNKKNI